jgi:hypothetical protein
MKLSDQDFEYLFSLEEFTKYYESLTVDEVMSEIDRLYSDGSITRVLFQHCALHRRLTDAACFDSDLAEHQRNAVIGVVTGLRDSIERLILPYVKNDMQERVRAALAGNDDYCDRFGSYPRAVSMIRVGARKPSGPYEIGVIGEILAKRTVS